jgi:hypothetical protein
MENTKAPWGWQKFGDDYSLVAKHGMREIIISSGNKNDNELDRRTIVNMNNDDDGLLHPVDPSHPNAKLIASAPDLLEACIDALKMCQDKVMPTENDLNIMVARLKVVIGKATKNPIK